MDKINFRHKKVLVTGGSGFLGSHLVEALLCHEAQVYTMDLAEANTHDKAQHYQVDLNDQSAVTDCIAKVQPDFIYHLAASLNRTRDFSEANTILKTNLNGTVNLLNALKDSPYQKLIYVSTSEVYGGKGISAPFKEEADFIPASPYALSKYCAEVAIQTFSEINAKNYTILRLFNFFGNGLPDQFFLTQLIKKLNNNADFDMTKGEQQRDFLHIDDVIRAMLLSWHSNADKNIYNVCSGSGKSIKAIALEMKALLKSTSQINFGALAYRENEVWNMVGDNSKLRSTLNWSPKYTFEQGIEDFLNKPS